MTRGLIVTIGAILALVGGCSPHQPPRPPPPSVPVAQLARGEVAPKVGLLVPFPAWAPLPDDGRVVGAEVLPPQPPYGASAVIVLETDASFDVFKAAYGRRLAERGFALRQVPIQPNLVIDAPVAQFQADERQGGHVVYVTFRQGFGVRVVQLTFWAPPAPRLAP